MSGTQYSAVYRKPSSVLQSWNWQLIGVR